MGKSKKKLDDLKKDLKTLQKKDMKKIVGGKNDNKKRNGIMALAVLFHNNKTDLHTQRGAFSN